MIDKQIIKEVTEKAKGQIQQKLVDDMSSSISWEAKQAISKKVAEDIERFYDEEIREELIDCLRTDKAVIMGIALAAQQALAEEVMKAFVQRAASNLSGYKGDQILKMLVK